MGLLGGIIGGVTGAVGAGLAGSALKKGYMEQQKLYEQRLDDVRNHRNNVYYQDPTQTAESQAAVTQAQELLDNQTQQIDNTNIVSGGTEEAKSLSKQRAAAAVGNMMQQQAVAGAEKKEKIWEDADKQIDSFTNYLAAAKLGQAQAKSNAINGAFSGLSSAAKNLPI